MEGEMKREEDRSGVECQSTYVPPTSLLSASALYLSLLHSVRYERFLFPFVQKMYLDACATTMHNKNMCN